MIPMSSRKLDPVKQLPYEICARCIWFYAHDQPDGPLPLLAVSPMWEQWLFLAPETWTSIYLDGSPDEACRAECFFHFSGRLPIEVVIDSKTTVLDLTVKYQERIKYMVFRTRSEVSYTAADIEAISVLATSVSFINLTHIYVEPPVDIVVNIPSQILVSCPALIGIHGAYIAINSVPYSYPATIILGLYGSGPVYRGLGNEVEGLRLRYELPESEEYTSQLFTSNTTDLKSLELDFGLDTRKVWLDSSAFTVTNRRHYLARIQEVISYVHYGLHTLRITLPWMDLFALIPRISAWQALRELDLVLDNSVVGTFYTFPITVDDIGHIRKLSISTTPRDVTGTVMVSVLHPFTEEVGLLNLEELKLEIPELYISQVMELLRTTKNLRVLHLIGFTPTASDIATSEPVLLYYLHTLVVPYENTLYDLETPNLVCLECSGVQLELYPLPYFLIRNLESITIPAFLLYQWNDTLVINNVKTKPLPRLSRLEITPGYYRNDPVSSLNYLNLVSISFREESGGFSTVDQARRESSLTHFMLDMLFSPENCPRLHTIKANRYPNWALTAAMLHRRNSLKDVAHIDSFCLLGYPQITVLKTIIWALTGDEEDPTHGILVAAEMDHIIHQRWGMTF